MQHVVTTPTAPFLAMNGALEVHQLPSWSDNLVWVLVCTETGEAAVVDGPEAATAVEYCRERHLNFTTLLNTHAHPDHIGINNELKTLGLLDAITVIGPSAIADQIPGLTRGVTEGDEVSFGEVTGRVMLTEGHVDGHVSYVFGDALFCGDTLFAGGCGYLFDGPPEKMFDSLLRLAQLPGNTRVCCAHEYTEDNLRYAWTIEPDNEQLAERIRKVWDIRAKGGSAVPSRIEEERATNPFLRVASPTILYVLGRAMPNADLSSPEKVFAAVRKLKDTKRYRQLRDEALPI